TGVSRPVDGHLAVLIDAINECGVPVLAVDIPSGLDADSGQPLGKAVRAAATATFAHLKRGLVLHPGAELAGRVRVVPIGAPGHVSERAGWDGAIIDAADALSRFPGRPKAAHKGTFGHLLILAGSLGKTGAAALCGEGALRVGTGLVTIATTGVAQPVLEARCRAELMIEQVIERNDAPLSERALTRLGEVIAGKSAVVIGPGLSTAPGISALVTRLAQIMAVPAVIDADGINVLAADPASLGRVAAPLVLTPHPGEMARLVGKSVPAVQNDRIGTAREAARRLQAVIALKGARTVVAAPDGRIWVNTSGNPGMATGGTGDVLAGVIGGLLAQGMSPLEATLLGVSLHGSAGDLAAERLGEPGLLAGDLLAELPGLLSGRSAERK
ncbi:MAG TPA: NAD(P)H-hydrate dehydratase, partial [Polyangia bacterium]|nr:NAD(P)H-hydrate dehydratase [Polyangia bacterium]